MHPMMDPRRPGSDTSSSYSGSTGSVWSTTDSVSFVYTDDPGWASWGYEDIRGAVTRKDDRRDDRRLRFAAHFLRGPFAGNKSKKKHHGSSSHHRDSDSRSTYSSSSSGSSSSGRRQRQFSRGPSPHMPPPPNAYPGSPHPHHEMHHPQHFDHFPQHGPQMGMGPPPPPPMAGPPPQAGFEAGFIQLGGGGPPPQSHDPWGNDAQHGGSEVWD
ncbi:hypothetical protein HD806DRAFT_202798 [Xylariaceae sp. AK1471]|nr:hypothetical protein HD806DRAFT_202798 [Xylariaceae sp. AK1471]